MTSALQRLNVINNVVPVLAKVNSVLTIPLILEYIQSQTELYDAAFLKTLRNYYLLDSGCIILDNFKQIRQWDISSSLSAPINTYFFSFDPSENSINVVLKKNGQDTVIDISNDATNEYVEDILALAGKTRYENLQQTLKKIATSRLINVDKSQLPVPKITDNGIELDYTNVNQSLDDTIKTFILNIMLQPYLTEQKNIDFLTDLKSVL
jgi:hypothetical protein